eukprot:8806956-Alexandrium_andersonii.AAC.1
MGPSPHQPDAGQVPHHPLGDAWRWCPSGRGVQDMVEVCADMVMAIAVVPGGAHSRVQLPHIAALQTHHLEGHRWRERHDEGCVEGGVLVPGVALEGPLAQQGFERSSDQIGEGRQALGWGYRGCMWMLKADLEYFASELGLPNANSNNPCIFCRCNRSTQPWTNFKET